MKARTAQAESNSWTADRVRYRDAGRSAPLGRCCPRSSRRRGTMTLPETVRTSHWRRTCRRSTVHRISNGRSCAGTAEPGRAGVSRMSPALDPLPPARASVGDAKAFHDSRQFVRGLGLVPRTFQWREDDATGDQQAGRYVPSHAPDSRSLIKQCERKIEETTGWLQRLLRRRHPNIAAVALGETHVSSGRSSRAAHRCPITDPPRVGSNLSKRSLGIF